MPANKALISGILFILTFIPGFIIAKSGRPYGQALFTVHKLIALAGVVLAAVYFTGLMKSGHITLFTAAAAIAAGLSVLALFGTGAALSALSEAPKALNIIHAASPWILAVSWGYVVFQSLK